MEKSSNKLVDLSVAFAIEILNLVKYLKSQHETIICNQIGRAGTSIGANIHEAQYAHGKADFVSKLQIALKEANETSYWLLLLNKTNIISTAEYDRLETLCREIRITLIASINTAKQNLKYPIAADHLARKMYIESLLETLQLLLHDKSAGDDSATPLIPDETNKLTEQLAQLPDIPEKTQLTERLQRMMHSMDITQYIDLESHTAVRPDF